MPTDEVRQQTRKAAVRILKSRLRTFIYSEKGAGPMLRVEEGFARGAEREWTGVLSLWNLTQDQGELHSLLDEVFNVAASEVLAIFDEPWEARKLIDRYRKEFSPVDLLKGTP